MANTPATKVRAKVLVIRGGAIGDFVLTLPVLAALRHQFPDCHLEVLGYPHIAQLAQAGGLADAVRSIEARAMATFFAPGGELSQGLAEYFSKFALTVSYLYDPDEVFKENVARVSSTQFIVGPHRPDETGRLHAAEVFLKPLEQLTIFHADAEPKLNPGEGGQTLPAGPWLALHPGSGSPTKNWPERKWRELLQRLTETTALNFLLVGGEAEGERLEQLCGEAPAARVHLARNLPLADLARLLKQCKAFIGHDSGISHLSAAVGLPGLVLWAHTSQTVWAPKGKDVQIVRDSQGLVSLSVSQVAAQLGGLLKQL
jgi:heptosyltransferase-3